MVVSKYISTLLFFSVSEKSEEKSQKDRLVLWMNFTIFRLRQEIREVLDTFSITCYFGSIFLIFI